MIRRKFLAHTLGVTLASLFARDAFAQQSAHDMPGMSGMRGMQGMSGMSGMASMPAGQMNMAPALAPPDALPAGAPMSSLRTLANESREPGVFRATLVALPVKRELLPGKPTPFWQYGSGTPGPVVGPLIDVREGDTVEIHFVNRLPQPSTIHWHGLPVPPDQDGNPTDLVAPGATRIYRFTLPKGSAGTYWYHPHPHSLTAEQVYRGLAGPFIVRADDDPLAGWPERHLFFSDLKLADDGSIVPNDTMDWMNGREGQFTLVNGARRPQIVVAGNERWRVWNGSNARYLRLTFDDGRPFTQVGTDGGLLEAPREGLTELLLAPAERAELIVSPGGASGRAVLTAGQYDRSKMAMPRGSLPPDPALPLADVRFEPASGAATHGLPKRLRAVPALGQPVARKAVVFGEAMDMGKMMSQSSESKGWRPAGMKFLVNGVAFEPHRTTLTSRRGDIELWSIQNDTDMDHPFHLHGTQFQVIERERGGVTTPEPFRAWRDTVNVRRGEIVRIATTQTQRGERMFHCHILEHEDLGMMGTLKVI
ncbi:multicopper oxidase family protein [Paraburkholderia fungorum]|uniref:multicopper oxidase family protein n=1 Tax=Paraburkholderia fungorum TaxID=134537 RepID=UPI003313682F